MRRKQRLKKERLEQEAEALLKENEEKRVLQEKRYRALRQNMDKMWDRGDANYAELVSDIGGKEQADEYISNLILDEDIKEEHYNGAGLEIRAYRHSKEAIAIISNLALASKNKDRKVIVEWEIQGGYSAKHKLLTYSLCMNFSELLGRLEWITSEEFGEDLNKWNKLAHFREQYGFWLLR